MGTTRRGRHFGQDARAPQLQAQVEPPQRGRVEGERDHVGGLAVGAGTAGGLLFDLHAWTQFGQLGRGHRGQCDRLRRGGGGGRRRRGGRGIGGRGVVVGRVRGGDRRRVGRPGRRGRRARGCRRLLRRRGRF